MNEKIDWEARLVASPASNPNWTREQAFPAWRALGFRKVEVFTTWVQSRYILSSDPIAYRALACSYELQPTSFHLPPVDPRKDANWRQMERAADAAKAMGARIVLFKARTIDDYAAAAPRALDRFEERGLVGVLQNHKNTALSTLENTLEALERIDDPRMKVLLEVGHLHAASCPWERAYPALKDRIELVHVKDIANGQSVPYGEGEIDLPGLFATLEKDAYRGNVVVEIEIRDNPETDRHLKQAVDYLRAHCFNADPPNND